MAIAVIDGSPGTLTYAGVGTNRGMIVRAPRPVLAKREIVHLLSSFGIVGGGCSKMSPHTGLLMPGDLVILVSDGIKERFDASVSDSDKVLNVDVAQLAERILQDWGRDTDDAAVLALRY